jgi:hypothetical protein
VWSSGLIDHPIKPAGDGVRMHQPPIWMAEQLAVILVGGTELPPFVIQHGEVSTEVCHVQRVERDGGVAAFGFAV